MPIIRELCGKIDLAAVWKHETGGRTPSAALLRMADELLPEAQALLHPAVIYERVPVREVKHSFVVLNGGRRLTSPDVARLLAPAREIAVGMATIGPELEDRASRFFEEDEPAYGYLLDTFGTAAVTDLMEQACGYIESLAKAEGTTVGFPLSPGDPTWPLEEQRVLFQLVRAQSIGISLTDSCLMMPKKTVSFVLGLGPEMARAAEGSQCDFCSVRERCRYRHELV